jgi:hypothetical protein
VSPPPPVSKGREMEFQVGANGGGNMIGEVTPSFATKQNRDFRTTPSPGKTVDLAVLAMPIFGVL